MFKELVYTWLFKFYFFGSIIAPYINQLRKWLYAKITGIDKEEF